MRQRLTVIGTALAVGLGSWAWNEAQWKKFAVVAPNAVYRSGQLKEAHFAAALDQLKLKTVVCLNPEFAARERLVCQARGVAFVYFPMPSNGHGEAEQFAEVLRLVRDPASQPILVHCSAGVARTGAAMALRRMLDEGWSLDRATAELASYERHGFIEPALKDHVAAVAARLRSEAAGRTPAAVR